jgi:hypothetical protein
MTPRQTGFLPFQASRFRVMGCYGSYGNSDGNSDVHGHVLAEEIGIRSRSPDDYILGNVTVHS